MSEESIDVQRRRKSDDGPSGRAEAPQRLKQSRVYIQTIVCWLGGITTPLRYGYACFGLTPSQ